MYCVLSLVLFSCGSSFYLFFGSSWLLFNFMFGEWKVINFLFSFFFVVVWGGVILYSEVLGFGIMVGVGVVYVMFLSGFL